ncbi:MAG: hypothetical protein NZ528_09160 [Caldilineales bacterium]|nr:hypothetical protein [Caldilineales bacterium]MDW8318892.1 hypothetical protein [Anaerolineae bacterium]
MLLSTALDLRPSPDSTPVVAFIGAAGKTGLLLRLGEEMAAAGRQVLFTSTGSLPAELVNRVPFSLLTPVLSVVLFELPTSLRGYRLVLVANGPADAEGRLAGLSPQVVCRLAGLPDVDAALVEAGEGYQPPESGQPLPPCTTHLVTVVDLADHRLPPAPPAAPADVAWFLYLDLGPAGSRSDAQAAAQSLARSALDRAWPTPLRGVLIGRAADPDPVAEVMRPRR